MQKSPGKVKGGQNKW